jgi:hypothetical protein
MYPNVPNVPNVTNRVPPPGRTEATHTSNNTNVRQAAKVKKPMKQKIRKLEPTMLSSRQAAPIAKRRSFADGLKPGMNQGRKM